MRSLALIHAHAYSFSQLPSGLASAPHKVSHNVTAAVRASRETLDGLEAEIGVLRHAMITDLWLHTAEWNCILL